MLTQEEHARTEALAEVAAVRSEWEDIVLVGVETPAVAVAVLAVAAVLRLRDLGEAAGC